MKLKTSDYCNSVKKKINIADWPTQVKAIYKSKDDYKKQLESGTDKLSKLQQLHYASNENAILIIFQAMDSAGKDGVIKHVMSGVNPQGCQVFSFKHPSATELEHDFLWRTTKCLPERGHIGIFNRSYYEEVLIAKVHPEIIKAEVPPNKKIDMQKLWEGRYKSIIDFENHLERSGTKIIKFFLHLSKEEQRQRFLARIDEPDKHWKFNIGDIEERKYWDQYMQAYEDCIGATSSADAPWYVIPADDKKNARLIILNVILETLEGLKMTYPKTSLSRRKELQELRKLLV